MVLEFHANCVYTVLRTLGFQRLSSQMSHQEDTKDTVALASTDPIKADKDLERLKKGESTLYSPPLPAFFQAGTFRARRGRRCESESLQNSSTRQAGMVLSGVRRALLNRTRMRLSSILALLFSNHRRMLFHCLVDVFLQGLA